MVTLNAGVCHPKRPQMVLNNTVSSPISLQRDFGKTPIMVTPAARGINHLKRLPYAVIMLEINVSLPGILDYTTLSR